MNKETSGKIPMPPPFRSTWRVYLPGAFVTVFYSAALYFAKFKQQEVKNDHDFVPIYGEDGKLEGFTHPTFVAAGDKKRAEAKQKEK